MSSPGHHIENLTYVFGELELCSVCRALTPMRVRYEVVGRVGDRRHPLCIECAELVSRAIIAR